MSSWRLATAWRIEISIALPVRPPRSAASSRRSRNVRTRTVEMDLLLPSCARSSLARVMCFELAQVAELIIDAEPGIALPAERLIQFSLRDPCASPDGRDGPDIGKEVAHIQALGLVQQFSGPLQLSLILQQVRRCDPPTVRVLRQPGMLAKLLALQQMLVRRLKVVLFAMECAQARVHVGGASQDLAVLGGRDL